MLYITLIFLFFFIIIIIIQHTHTHATITLFFLTEKLLLYFYYYYYYYYLKNLDWFWLIKKKIAEKNESWVLFWIFFSVLPLIFFSSLHSMKIEWWLMRKNLDPDFCYRKKNSQVCFCFFYSWEKATTHHTPIQTNKSFQFRNPDFLIKKRLSYWNEKNYYVVICVCMCLFCSITIIIWCSFSGQKKNPFQNWLLWWSE